VLEIIFRLVLGIVIGCFFAAPVSLVVLIYKLATGHSLSEAARIATEVGIHIVGEVASQA
jgi:hypothetical protein